MSHSDSHSGTVRDPGVYAAPAKIKILMLVLIAVGIASFLMLLPQENGKIAWSIYLVNHFYFLMLGLGGLFFASIQWLTGSMWSAPVRRVAESFTAYLPFVLVTTLILFLGTHSIYLWSHPEHVKGDILLEGKASYLNPTFFMIRQVVAVLIWVFFAWKMIGNSVLQDQRRLDHSLTMKNKSLSPMFLILFSLSFTMVSFDQIMSLDPHWFSTIFGIYCFAGMFYSTLALTCLITIALIKKGALEGIANENHLHDLGKFMFAFSVFWAYIGFSQFMLIWYANLPEETGYFLKRFASNSWFAVALFLFIGKFLTPFFLLLPRDAKRNKTILKWVAVWMLFAQWVDVLWMVQPEFFLDGPKVGILGVGVTLGFLGLFGTATLHFFSRHTVVAIGDPRLEEAVFHHHQ
jgi:hypothetical protein